MYFSCYARRFSSYIVPKQPVFPVIKNLVYLVYLATIPARNNALYGHSCCY